MGGRRGSRLTRVTAAGNVCNMSKVRRGGYVFLSWKGDHGPRHVHVYRDGQFVLKWDLDHHQAMAGQATRKILDLIAILEAEGRL